MPWVLFFDGDCALCSKSVQTVARLDRRGVISFAPLQGEFSRQNGFSHHAAKAEGTMVLMREPDGKAFIESDALIELAGALGGGWRILAAFRVVWKPLRDSIYRLFARNRFRFMGKSAHCALPDPELLKRLRN